MTLKASQAILTTSPSIPKILRIIEWISLGIPSLRMLFPLLYEPLGYEVASGDYLVFGVLSLLVALSFRFPLERSLWQRRAYIWIEIGALLATRLFSDWGLDLILWFVLVKSCFLLSRREVIFTVIASGIAWQIAITHYFVDYLSQPIEVVQADIEALYAIPLPVQVADAVLNSTSIFIAANSLIIFLCLTIISERKSRQREAALTKEVELLAADLERARIARDIHDSLGHTLTSLDVQLELAQRLYEKDTGRVHQALSTSKLLASQSVQEVRRAVSTMREAAFDLNAALAHLIEPFNSDAALTVESKIDLPELPLQTSHQLYCIVKEALENIRRHSKAQRIWLRGEPTAKGIAICIEDDGIGFDPTAPATGFGLRGMRERSQAIDGLFQITSHPGRGTRLQITIPHASTHH
ncbi:MAG: sensor histidine kinase [Phormidesmis sp.]